MRPHYVPDTCWNNARFATLQNMDDVLRALRARLDRARAPRAWPAPVSRAVRDGTLPPGTRLPPIRSVAAALDALPHHGQRRLGAARPRPARSAPTAVAARPSPRPPRHATGRYRRALERQADFDLDLSTGVPDGDLLPSLRARARPADDGRHARRLPRRAGAARADAPAARRLAVRRRGAHRRRRRDGRARPRRALAACASATAWWSSTPASRRCWTCWSRIGAEVVGVPMDDEGLLPERAGGGAAPRPTAAVFLQPRAQNPTGVSLTTVARRRARGGAGGHGRPGGRGRLGRRHLDRTRPQPRRAGSRSRRCTCAATPSPTAPTCAWPPSAVPPSCCATPSRGGSSARAGAAGCCSGSWSAC